MDWPAPKEKAANVAANSPLLAGEFTEDLAGILEDVRRELGELIEPLRLDELLPQEDAEAVKAAVEKLEMTKPITRVWVLIGLPANQYAAHAEALERIALGKEVFFDSTIR